MKRLLSKTMRSVIALLVVASMILGTCVTVFAAPNKEELTQKAEAAIAEATAKAEEVYTLVAENYEEWYKLAYDYATEKEYVANFHNALHEAESELGELDTSVVEDAEYKAALDDAKANALSTLAALDTLVETAIAANGELTEAMMNDFFALLDTLSANLADVAKICEMVGIDVAEDAWAKYEADIKPEIEKAIAEAKAFAEAKLTEAYNAFVEAAAKAAAELPGEVDAFLYDWLYNNPDKVIGFFEEYGDDMVKFIAENQEAVCAVLGFVYSTFGKEAAEYVMENPKEALVQFVEWYDTYGERTWEMIKVYLDELGITAKFEELKNPENVMAVLNELCGLVEKYGPEVAEKINSAVAALLEKYGDELQGYAEELLKEFVEEIRPEVEALIAELEAQLEALEAELEAKLAELENAVGEAKKQLEEAIAKLEAQIAAVKAQIEALNAKLEKAYNDILAFVEAVKDVVEAIDDVIAALEAQAKEELKEAVAKLVAAVDAINNEVAEALAELAAAVESAAEYADAKVAEVVAFVEALVEEVQNTVDALVEAFEEVISEIYEDATTFAYTVDKDTYYVALGDSSVTGYGLEAGEENNYGYRLAKDLGLKVDTQYANLGFDDLRVEDIAYILGAVDSVDAYGQDVVFPQVDVEELRALFAEEIAKADLVTLGFDNNFSLFMQAQLNNAQPYELDWARYVGNEGTEYVVEALEKVAATLAEAGVPEEFIGSMLYTVESYAYGYVAYAASYPAVINAIHAINEDAKVILVGAYNPLENMSVAGLDLGDYVQYIVDLANAYAFGCAAINPNTIFVPAPAVETILEAEAGANEVDMLTFVANIMGGSMNLHASEAGHEYIKDQILGAVKFEDDTTKCPFIDVNKGAYYYDAVMWAVENGITYGKTPITFEPNSGCTRAQAVAFLWRAAGCPEPQTTENPFTDVQEGAYYYDAVLWAVENGITYGKTATKFDPKATCTRAQIVAFMYRAEGEPAVAGANPFVDVKANAYYHDAVLWAVENGITFGKTETTFEPSEDCERCHIVSFLYRYSYLV